MQLEISSKENKHYKELKKLSKEKGSYIFIEGKKLLCQAVNSSIEIKKVFFDKEDSNFLSELLPKIKDCELIDVKKDLLASIYTTDSMPSGDELVIALAGKPQWELTNLLKKRKNLIFLERIQDPGNLGAIIRSALAFDACGIILSKGSTDPYNTKVIRASAGAVFDLPVVFAHDYDGFKDEALKNGYNIIAVSVSAKKKFTQLKLKSPNIFLFGNEGSGLSKEFLNLSSMSVSIPQLDKIQSLNLGVAVSIVLWELFKGSN